LDGFDDPLQGLEDASRMLNLTRGLVRRGYTDKDINKILGSNFLRVFKNVID
jgi:membrane dipeptidase